MGYGGTTYFSAGGYSDYKNLQNDQKALVNGTKRNLTVKEIIAIRWCLEHEAGDFPSMEWQEQSPVHWKAALLIADIQHEEINREAYNYLLRTPQVV